MSTNTWVLIDNEGDNGELNREITSSNLPGALGNWKIHLKTLRGGLRDGVQVVEIDNGKMRVSVLPTRGMGIWKVDVGDQVLGWRSPVRGPVHPAHVPLFDPSGLGWLDGFDEFLVRCGLESNGAPDFDENGRLLYPLHGRIGNRPAHFVDVTVDDVAGVITLRGIVEETRFHFQKLRMEASLTIPLDGTSLQISDQVQNFGGSAAEMQMLYHINVGEPMLAPGAEFVAPIRSVRHRDQPNSEAPVGWQQYAPAEAGKVEDCYFMEMEATTDGQTLVLLKGDDGNQGVVVAYNTQQLPYFALWKNEVATQDGYVTGLEPATNYPNSRSVEKAAGRVITLAPDETWSADLQVDYLETSSQVVNVEQEITKLKQGLSE